MALDVAGLERHADPLTELLHACVHHGASVSFILPFDLNQARAYWREKVAPAVGAGGRLVLIATVAGEVAGTVQLDLDTWPNQAHRADVAKLLVHPRHRRAGLARALMLAVEDRAAAAGRWLLTLDTASEAAERLYLSLGYQRAGRIPDYARAPLEDRIEATTIMFKLLPNAVNPGANRCGQPNRAE
jgi:ribosomal protein S18 acetylase RimI-like enzyme